MVASALRSTFSDGVWWVELASLTDANLVPQFVAAIFKLPGSQERTDIEGLTTYFQDRHLLLILDNCEHLIDSCAKLVDKLLRSCPQLHILITSHETLRIDGEVEWPVSPLAAPGQGTELDTLSMEKIMQIYEAVQLFIERAQATQPTIAWTEQDVAPVARICRQLDGIPLAIELAASRLKGLTVNELANRLDSRFRLLSGMRTALPRHQTLRATLDWSYNLLSADERALLRRLSVFSGGWTLDATEAIAETQPNELLPIDNPVELLLRLVNRSLVIAETRHRETRYRLLETIREYALEKLQELGELEAVRARHFTHYLALAEQWKDPAWTGRQLAAWTNQIDVEMGNLRTAFAWGMEQTDNGEHSVRLAGALWLFWYTNGGFREGQTWLNNALSHSTAASPQTRATALYGSAYVLRFSATPLHRTALVEEALVLSKKANDNLGLAHCYSLLGEIAFELADYPRSLEYFQRALDLFQTLECPLFFNTTLYRLANVWLQLGQVDKAIALVEKSSSRRIQDESYLFQNGLTCYALALLQADERQGTRLIEEELARRRMLNAPEMLAPLLHEYSRQLLLSDDPQDVNYSFQMLTECLALWQQLGTKWSMGGERRARVWI